MINTGEILQKAREKKGYTQEALAKELKITLRTVQRYETGDWPKYKSKNIKDIDNLLGTKLADMIYDSKFRKDQLVEDVDSFIITKTIKHDAILETILEVLAEQEAARTQQPVTKLITELNKTVSDKEASILDQLKRVGG